MNDKCTYIFKTCLVLYLMCISFPHMAIAQNDKIVKVDFEIKGRKLNSKDLDISFFTDSIEIKPLLCLGGFVVPDFGNAKAVDVCFSYKKKKYCIDKLPINKFETDWVFGIEKGYKQKKTAPIKDIKLSYFIRFYPKDGSDGTQVVVTILKK